MTYFPDAFCIGSVLKMRLNTANTTSCLNVKNFTEKFNTKSSDFLALTKWIQQSIILINLYGQIVLMFYPLNKKSKYLPNKFPAISYYMRANMLQMIFFSMHEPKKNNIDNHGFLISTKISGGSIAINLAKSRVRFHVKFRIQPEAEKITNAYLSILAIKNEFVTSTTSRFQIFCIMSFAVQVIVMYTIQEKEENNQ